MPFEKGKSGNPRGKAKGTQSKATTEFKDALNNLLEEAAPDMLNWLSEIDDPFKRFEVLSRFAEYIHPKLARTDTTLSGPNGGPVELNATVKFLD